MKLNAPAVVHRWKKFIALGCSHGELVDRSVADAAVKFKEDYKPDVTVHLGDWADSTAFRSGAKGGKDESADIDVDILAGLTFLDRLRPTVVFIGNHEDRIWGMRDHPKALIAKAAGDTVKHCTKFITENLKARFIDHYKITHSWVWLGPYKLGHGWMFNECAIRDHADYAGNCIIAHLHRYGVERGRRLSGATGICVGMIADPDKLTYADRHKAKSKWTQSLVYGEYTDTQLVHSVKMFRESPQVEFERL